MIALAFLLAVVATGAGVALHRDLERADARRRMRTLTLDVDLSAFTAALAGAAIAAREFEQTMQRVAQVISTAGFELDGWQRRVLANIYREGRDR